MAAVKQNSKDETCMTSERVTAAHAFAASGWPVRGREIGECGTCFEIRATSGLTTRWLGSTYTRNTWTNTRNQSSFLLLVLCISCGNSDSFFLGHSEAEPRNDLCPAIKAQGVLGDRVPRRTRARNSRSLRPAPITVLHALGCRLCLIACNLRQFDAFAAGGRPL
jgi:hypothetical protein